VLLDLAFTYREQGQFDAAQPAFEEAMRLARSTASLRTALMATYYLADMFVTQGKLQQAARLYQQGLQWCQPQMPPAACWMDAGLGALLYEWDDISAARDHLQRAVELAHQGGELKVLMYARIPLAHTLEALGRPDEALAALDAAAQIAQQLHMPEIAGTVDAARVMVWLKQGQVDTAARWLRSHGVSAQNDTLSPGDITMLAWLALAQHRTASATAAGILPRVVELLADYCERARTQHQLHPYAQHLVLLALAYQALGCADLAVSTLATAVTLAEPMGLVRTFSEHGAAMGILLRQVARRTTSSYVAQLAAACEAASSPSATRDAIGAPADQPRPEPLHRREIEVLRHVANGLSNQEIADEMVMAVSTVKWYLRNIYGKLQVSRRTQALARARELQLL
jgi:LuxR family maltose regulon positive regulatory protein